MYDKQNDAAVETAARDFLAANWETILRRSASHTARRALAEKRWEARLRLIDRAAIAVGVFLIVQFPIACYAFAQLERAAVETCAAL